MGSSTISLGLGLGGGKSATSSGAGGGGGGFVNGFSIKFDGSDDYYKLSSGVSFSGAYTLSMWFKQTTDALGILAFGSDGTYIEPQGSNGRLLVSGYGAIHSGTNAFNFGQWSHVMLARDSSNNVEAWVNGVSIGTSTKSGTAKFDNFGVYHTSTQPFGGLLDEIALFNSDKSSNISTIYNGGIPNDLSSLSPTHWWRMGDIAGGSGTTITDQGSGGINGILINGPTFSTDVPT